MNSIIEMHKEAAEQTLTRYETMCRAIAECVAIDEVKAIRDKASALQAYARQAKNRAAENQAANIRVRAEVRTGELLRKTEKDKGGRPEKNRSSESTGFSEAATLDDLGISKGQSSRWQEAAEVAEAYPEVIEEVLENEQRLPTTMRILREGRKRRNKALRDASPVLVTVQRYGCIVIDPPWEMQKIERDIRPNQAAFDYPTMSEDELRAFDVAGMASDDCHLFCWTTQKHLPLALALVEAWGFRYVLLMVWHKAGGFQPVGLPQYNCEFIVYARRGAPEFIETTAFPVCFEAPRREHSRKPDIFYQTIARVTAGPRIDVFSRESREGFMQFGNEPAKFGS